MAEWKLPWSGGCRCNRIRLAVTAPPLLASACHCRGCQSMASSAFSLTLTIPANGFSVTEGEPVTGGLHGSTHHFFCWYCKTWMFTRAEGFDDFVNLRPTMLDDHAWFAPYIEVHTRERLPWASTPARHSFETQPELSAYEGLIREYAEHGARPA
jgi:hypothetical protein